MRVLNSNFVRVFIVLVLVLSFSLSSAFAANNLFTLNYPEPATSPTQGYLVVETGGAAYTYAWNTSLYGVSSGDNDNNDAVVVDITISPNEVVFTFHPLGSYTYYNYSLVCFAYTEIYFKGSGDSAGTLNKYATFSSPITSVYYSGNVGTVTNNVPGLKAANVSFNGDSEISVGVSSILSKLGTISSDVKLSYDQLLSLYNLFKTYPDDVADIISILRSVNTDTSSVVSILQEWANTSLNESTSPLPNHGLDDFESSQGSLRNDSDVSSSLDDVFNDVDFGSFSNGFSAVWGLVDGILYSHPIFFTLVILVLSLGLLNLIFNRR